MNFFKNLVTLSVLSLSILANSSFSFETKAKNAVLYDFTTDTFLFSKNADSKIKPASITKVMTAYITFYYINQKIFSINEKFTVSKKAWSKGGSKMFLKEGEAVSLENLINGMIIQSGNDASITIAEGIAGTESKFADFMTKLGKEIGLKNSNFKNASGWPEDNHYMTARDIIILSKRLIADFPEYYHYFSKKNFSYNGINQKNRNSLINENNGVDGIKTGTTDESGYSIVVSAKKNGRRLIAVVNNLNNKKERNNSAWSLLRYGFKYFSEKVLLKKDTPFSKAKVWMGSEESIALVSKKDISLTLPKINTNKTLIELTYNSPIIAPVKKGDKIAQLKITPIEGETKTFPLYAEKEIKLANIFQRFTTNFFELIKNIF